MAILYLTVSYIDTYDLFSVKVTAIPSVPNGTKLRIKSLPVNGLRRGRTQTFGFHDDIWLIPYGLYSSRFLYRNYVSKYELALKCA